MSFDITSPSSVGQVDMLVTGDVGSGKTTFAGTAADFDGTRDVLVISPDKGESVLKDRDLDVIRINSFGQLDDVYEFLCEAVRFRDDQEKLQQVFEKHGVETTIEEYQDSDKVPEYRTVVMDSLTELSRYSEDFVTGNKPSDRITDRESMEGFSDWEAQKQNMVGVLRKFRDLDVNFIGTATTKRDKDEKTGEVTLLPNISGSAREYAEEAVELIGYTFRKDIDGEVNYGIMFNSGDSKYICKQRYDLPDVMKNPTFEKVYNHVQ